MEPDSPTLLGFTRSEMDAMNLNGLRRHDLAIEQVRRPCSRRGRVDLRICRSPVPPPSPPPSPSPLPLCPPVPPSLLLRFAGERAATAEALTPTERPARC